MLGNVSRASVKISAGVSVKLTVKSSVFRVMVSHRVRMEVVLQSQMQSFPPEPMNIRLLLAVDVFHLPQSVRLNDDAP